MVAAAVNAFPIVRAGYGVLLVSASGPVVRRYGGHPADRRARVVARILGVRHLTQAVLTLGTPGPTVLALGVEADLAHAASMLGLAAVNRSRRRATMIDGVGAGCFALAGALLARRTPPAPTHSHRDGTPARLAAWREALAARLASRVLPSLMSRPGQAGGGEPKQQPQR